MLHASTVGAFLAFGIFLLGIDGYRRMQARVEGRRTGFRIVHDLTGKYAALIREGTAPGWPLIAFRICIPLGIVLMIASIIWRK